MYKLLLIFFIISIILVFLVGFLVRGIHLTFIQWLMSGLLLLIGAIVFLSLGTILTNFKDEKTASVFSDILFLALAMLGGLWFPTSQFPEWLQMLSKLTPTYHFRELAVGYISNNEIPSKSILIMIIYAIIFISISLIISKNRKQDIA
ncbi:ABC transporter permease [Lactococcus cremoris]|uniref:ABC transporter permease n=1 Tax=Lactococcus lactis subsp. cremoris TaxID=1359 RepID=UPI0035CA63CC